MKRTLLFAFFFVLGAQFSVLNSYGQGCVTVGNYVGADIFHCNGTTSDCGQCDHCRVFTLINNCNCTIDELKIDPVPGVCFEGCGFLDDPTHATWQPLRTGCAEMLLEIHPAAGSSGLAPGQTLAVRLCASASANFIIHLFCNGVEIDQVTIAVP